MATQVKLRQAITSGRVLVVLSSPQFSIIPFDRNNPPHTAFVEATFVSCARESWPWNLVESFHLRRDLQAQLRRPDVTVRVATATDDASNLLVWCAASPLEGELIFGYTLAPFRTKGDLRVGVGVGLARACGLKVRRDKDGTMAPVTLRYWTPTAAVLRERGYNIRPWGAIR